MISAYKLILGRFSSFTTFVDYTMNNSQKTKHISNYVLDKRHKDKSMPQIYFTAKLIIDVPVFYKNFCQSKMNAPVIITD